jgi:triosephosphate isomerase (TIM)
MRRKIIAGNWKMNCSREEAFSLATEVAGMVSDEKRNDALVILAPPFVYLAAVSHIVSHGEIRVAAQNCSDQAAGAYTGEVSAAMIRSVGASHVIIGHSERRTLFHETHELLARKVVTAIDYELTPIFCIGETWSQREAGNHFEVIEAQLNDSVFALDENDFRKLIIAYEPVWAIGTGKTATSDQAQEMHAYIRSVVAGRYGNDVAEVIPVLYGGSCNENNAKELFSLPDVDGGLIGGASLKSRSFMNIIHSA